MLNMRQLHKAHVMVPSRLKAARIAAGLTQEKLGVLTGIDESSARARISYYESGTNQPNFDTVCRMARVLNVPEAYLYTLDDALAAKILEWHRHQNTHKPSNDAG